MVAVALVMTTDWNYQSYTKKTCLAQIRHLVYQPTYCMYKMSSCSSVIACSIRQKVDLNIFEFVIFHGQAHVTLQRLQLSFSYSKLACLVSLNLADNIVFEDGTETVLLGI